MKKFLASLASLALAMVALAGVAHAQQVQLQPGVARVSLIRGDVSMQRGDSGDWVAATLNTPLVYGDTISTGPDSRAEVQLDFANVLRLDSNTTVKIAALNRDHIQVQVAQGLANFDVVYQDNAQAEIDTPSVAVHPLGNGSYRIEVDSNDLTMVTVRQGEADVSTPQGSTRVESGQLITIQGQNSPQYQIANAGPEDSWDRWNRQRDRLVSDASAWHHTNRYYTGAQDLGAYGRWIYVPDYGQVWTPYVTAGWAPYRDGRWVWEPFYGWTWVSYAPWGWAPYHYGRWFLYAGDWCWWPGPLMTYPNYYPVWAPAYVSFFGFGYGGANFSIGFGFGNVGWMPIGPADPFFPWYGGFGLNVISFSNYGYYRRDWDRYHGWAPLYRGRRGFSNFDHLMNDRRLRRGVSWMRANQFGRARVPRHHGLIDRAEFRRARMFNGRVPVVPTRASLRTTNRAANPASFRHARIGNRHFFTRGGPARTPTPFHQERAHMEQVVRNYRNGGGRGFNPSANRGPSQRSFTARPGAPSRAMTGTGRAIQQGRKGYRNFGRPTNVRPAPAQHRETPGNIRSTPRAGWHTFGNSPATRGNGAWAEQGRQAPAQRRRVVQGSGPARNQGGWRTSTPSSRRSGPAQRQGGQRNFTPTGRSSQPAQRQNWRIFTPKSGQPRNSPPARGRQSAPAQRQGGGWRTFRPSPRPSSGGARRQSRRPPLNLRQPIVERRQSAPRNNGPSGYRNYGYNRGSYGGRGRAPAYHAPRANYGGGRGGYAPRRGGSAPRGGGYRGGSRSHGGGGRRGGGHPGGRGRH